MHLNFLSKPLGLPYLPITPTFPLLGPLGLIPLPSKWMIKFSPPIPMEEYTPEDALDYLTVSHLTQQIRENIQDGIKELLLRRKRPFFLKGEAYSKRRCMQRLYSMQSLFGIAFS
jgi:hypothetical protein